MSSGAEFAAPSARRQTAKTVDIKAFIDEQPISAYQWFLVALCFLVVVADGMDVAIMGFVTPSILQEPWWPGPPRTDSGESLSSSSLFSYSDC